VGAGVAPARGMTKRTRTRWLGVLFGILLGAVDTYSASAFGVTFRLNQIDVTIWVFAYFATSFAALGYVVGYVIEARQRERESAQRLEDARLRLAQNEKLVMLGQLASAIAHEVRNPLAIIRSSIQNLEEGLADGDVAAKKSCAFVIDEIDRLTRVSASLLGFVRPLAIERKRVRVPEVFDRTQLLARAVLDRKGMRLSASAPADLPELAGDPDLLCQALLGLVVNAVDAAPAGSEIALDARTAPDRTIEIDVLDKGPGIAVELRTKVFEPFFTTRSEGHGLGLAVVKQIVESHGGRIEAKERDGGGARFTMRFPTTQVREEAA
jgi:two-component system sensor histidine kinase AtoS